LDFTDHVLEDVPFKVEGVLLLVESKFGHDFVEVMLEVHKGGFEIRVVELIGDTPS
jgi:hypothetical protein